MNDNFQKFLEKHLNSQNAKITGIVFLVIFIIAIIYAINFITTRAGKIAVDIQFAPNAAQIFIDDQNNYPNNDTVYLAPGPHKFYAYFEGFQAYEETIEISNDNNYIHGGLIPNSESGTAYYNQHIEEWEKLDTLTSEQLSNQGNNERKKWPIIQHLPYTNSAYGLGYTIKDDQLTLTITVSSEAQIDNAIDKLRSLTNNTSLTTYNIHINDFDNQLDGNFNQTSSSDPTTYLQKGYQNFTVPHQINPGQQSDNYYYTTIYVGEYAGYIPVTYRVILKRENSSWQLVSTPYPLLTVYNTPNIDQTILDAVNNLTPPTYTTNNNYEA